LPLPLLNRTGDKHPGAARDSRDAPSDVRDVGGRLVTTGEQTLQRRSGRRNVGASDDLMRAGRTVQGRDQRAVAADFDQSQRLAPRLEQCDHVRFQRRVTFAVDVLAQASDDRLLQLLQTLAIDGRIVGQRKREVDAAPAELGIDDHVGRHRDMIGKLLIDLRLAQAHETQRQRAAGQARAEPPAQERHQLVAHHRLQFAGRSGQRHDHLALRFKDQPHGGPVGVLQIGPAHRDLRLPAQVGAELFGRRAEAPRHGLQYARVLFQLHAREFRQCLACNVVGGRAQPAGDKDQIGASGREAQRRHQIRPLVVDAHRAHTLQTQRPQRPGQEIRVPVGKRARQQFATGDHDHVPRDPRRCGLRGAREYGRHQNQ